MPISQYASHFAILEKPHISITQPTTMKLFAPIILALAAASEAAFCNAGWGLPSGASCPGGFVSPTPTTTQ
jgi:hypothetical protein